MAIHSLHFRYTGDPPKLKALMCLLIKLITHGFTAKRSEIGALILNAVGCDCNIERFLFV